MNRRELLRYTSAGTIMSLSGCMEYINPTTNDITKEDRIRIDVKQIANNPNLRRYDLDFNVQVSKKFVDKNNPPSITVSVVNKSDVTILLDGTTRKVFNGVRDTSNSVLLLEETDWRSNQVKSNSCWNLHQEIPLSEVNYRTTLKKSERKEIELYLIGNSNTDGCIPTGSYRFETNYSLLLPDENGNRLSNEFTWGFIIDITRDSKN